MQTRRLGPDGPEVSAIGFGAMNLSVQGRPDEAQAITTVGAVLDAGITLIDTADAYCLNNLELRHNERLLVKALAGRPEKVLVTTKGGMSRPKGEWTRDGSPAHLTRACARSLETFGWSEHVLYQLHAPDPKVKFVESVRALARLKSEGKIRHVGLSNVSVEQLEVARQIIPIQTVQNRYNPGFRKPERDGMLEACEKHGIAFLAYAPFGGRRNAASFPGFEKLAAEAARRGVSPHRLVLAWLLAKSPVIIPLFGARRPETVRDSAAASELSLSKDDVAAVEATFEGLPEMAPVRPAPSRHGRVHSEPGWGVAKKPPKKEGES
jgi:aryl-alcohol dehydrogenase-like predicted oxidoreductase